MHDKSAPGAPVRSWPWPDSSPSYDLPVFQLKGERDRLVVVGRRTDDHDRCELLLVADTGGSFALYPHGAAQLGVRLAKGDAVTVARAILGAVESAPGLFHVRLAFADGCIGWFACGCLCCYHEMSVGSGSDEESPAGERFRRDDSGVP